MGAALGRPKGGHQSIQLAIAGVMSSSAVVVVTLLGGGVASLGIAVVAVIAGLTAVSVYVPIVLVLASLVIEPDLVFGISNGPALVKLGALIATCLIVCVRGADVRSMVAIFAYTVLLALSTYAPITAGYTKAVAAAALLGFVSYWALAGLRPSAVAGRSLLIIISLLPVASVIISVLVLQPTLHYSTIFVEYASGISRLQAGVVPSHLAFLCLAAVLASEFLLILHALPSRLCWFFIVLNSTIATLTFTRTALIALLVILIPAILYFMRVSSFSVRFSTTVFVSVIVVGLWVAFVGPSLAERTINASSGGGVDTSGRADAWAFYLAAVGGHQVFGLGLGAATVVTLGTKFAVDFPVPHNEYIRAFVDGGWVGLVILAVGIGCSSHRLFSRQAIQVRSVVGAFFVATLVLSITDNTLSTVQFMVPSVLAMVSAAALSADSSYAHLATRGRRVVP